jgi:DNA-binding FadR family transcriptional regulator
MAERFGVSRTVIREAIAALKADGVVETRRGSGAFVRQVDGAHDRQSDPLTAKSIEYLLLLIDMRRGMESEVTALAASRRSSRQLDNIKRALLRIDAAAAAGFDGAEEDLAFHLSIAEASNNPYWVKVANTLMAQTRTGIRVTRACQALRGDSTKAVRTEHYRIFGAIAVGAERAARAAARTHLANAAKRVREAEKKFWQGEGGKLARKLERANKVRQKNK